MQEARLPTAVRFVYEAFKADGQTKPRTDLLVDTAEDLINKSRTHVDSAVEKAAKERLNQRLKDAESMSDMFDRGKARLGAWMDAYMDLGYTYEEAKQMAAEGRSLGLRGGTGF